MKTKTKTVVRAMTLSLLLGVGACDAEEQETPKDDPAGETGGTPHVATTAPPPANEAAAPDGAPPSAKAIPRPHRVAPDAKEAFGAIVELIETHYVDGPLSEDELYTAAAEGVLQRLIQVHGHEINSLLSPEELERLMEGTRGHIVGVGIMIEEVGGTLVVRGLVPGGPAETSALQAGDRILGVDGQRLKDKTLYDAVKLIRGEEGTEVDLFVQRDTEEWHVSIERRRVEVSSVESRALDDGVGYVRVNGFAKNTSADLTAQLTELQAGGMERLVLDLRACPGGLLDGATEVAELFLPAGKRVVTMRGPKGEEHRETEREDPFESVPMVVIVGPKTASGGEILAAALSEHDRATLVGATTLGKGTVEAIHDLPNGWALKLSQARFFSPSGEARQGNGVRPQIPVAVKDKAPRIDELSADDPAMRAAIEVLSIR